MFSEIKIHGYCDVNYAWSKVSDTVTDDVINSAVTNGVYTPAWDDDTITLATFREDISASDISQALPIIKYVIYRQDIAEDVEYKIAETASDETHITDYNTGSDKTYKYIITPIYDDNGLEVRGEPIVTEPIAVDWNSVSIVGLLPTDIENEYIVDKDNIWVFSLNIDDITYKPQTNKTVTPGMSRYPKVYASETNYLTTDITCLLGNITCESNDKYVNDNIEKIEKWIEFQNNGQLKLFKDVKGHILPCEITDTSYTIDGSTPLQMTSISFSIVQLADRKDISAYSVEV